jgi:diguanylate cyclase (GGDEF)-like protein/PAS domain S-box-containing protein
MNAAPTELYDDATLTVPHTVSTPSHSTSKHCKLETQLEQWVRVCNTIGRECQEGIVVCDAQGLILFVNAAFERANGYCAAELCGRAIHLLYSDPQIGTYGGLERPLGRQSAGHGEVCTRHRDGSIRTQWLSLAAVEDPHGVITHYVAVFTDRLQSANAADRIRHLAHIDPLTRLPNRRRLVDKLRDLQVAALNADTRLALLLLDLDRFKHINDSLGHEAGDALLEIVAERLRRLLRRSDVVARMGGDEFAIVLTGIIEQRDVDQMAARILAEIARPLVLADREVVICASVGICMFPSDASSVSEMLRDADTAMYAAKQRASGTWVYYSPAMSQRACNDFDIETGLRQAIKQGEFELYYQPQLDLRTASLCGAEALIRWNRPGVGLVMPGDFISLAEERGLIADIDAWALREATQQVARWDRAGVPMPRVAVNLSASQFHHRNLLSDVRNALLAGGITGQRLELEITEGVLLQDCTATAQLMRELRGLGVEMSIDDFGAGYSSLGYLRRLPLDKLKIDRSFILEMLQEPAVEGIVRGIIALAHGLGLRVIAEGVETPAQLAKLRELNCDCVQGFLVGRPLPADQFARSIRDSLWSIFEASS